MSIKITYLGHSGFLFDAGKHAIAVDPFLTGNPVARHKPGDINCKAVAITHGHADHVGDAVAIARTNDATIIANYEIAMFASGQGVKRIEPGNIGGRIKTDFGWVAFTQAFHSSSFEDRYMGMPCGLVIHIGGVTIYHCGDTGLFSDMKLIGEIYKPAIACIPIGDRFTMGPELATKAAELIRPKVAIPIHYKTFPDLLVSDASGFKPSGIEVKVIEPGESWQYG
jgi:L-ascorbate metabolism protein UlaG (beta-lactamase superfamily)